MAKKLESNEDMVLDLMTYSPHGPLCQVFIMEAIEKYAEMVAEAPPIESSFINGETWKNIAIDVIKRCDAFYNRHDKEQA